MTRIWFISFALLLIAQVCAKSWLVQKRDMLIADYLKTDQQVTLELDRTGKILETSQAQLEKYGPMKGQLRVKFEGDQTTDNVDATLKEYFSLLSNDLLHPDYKLFYSNEGVRQKNSIRFGDAICTPRFPLASDQVARFMPVITHVDYIKKLRHVGNVIAMAILNKQFMDITFDSSLYNMIIDTGFHEFQLGIKCPYPGDKPIDHTSETDKSTEQFFISDDKPGGRAFSINFIPSTSGPKTTHSHQEGYTLTFTDEKVFQDAYVMVNEFEKNEKHFSMAVICLGIFEIIPKDAFTDLNFSKDKIETLISGETEKLDRLDLQQFGLTNLKVFQWTETWLCEYWKITAKNKKLHLLLSFITGTSRLPIGLLDGDHDKSEPYINIFWTGETDTLPTSDPYTNTLHLPLYSSRDMLHKQFDVILGNACGAPVWFVSAARFRSCP